MQRSSSNGVGRVVMTLMAIKLIKTASFPLVYNFKKAQIVLLVQETILFALLNSGEIKFPSPVLPFCCSINKLDFSCALRL